MSQYSNIRYDLDYLIEKINNDIFSIRHTLEELLIENNLMDDAEGKSVVECLDLIKDLPKYQNTNKLVEIIDGSVKELTKFDMAFFYHEDLAYVLEEGSLSNLPRLSLLEISIGEHFCRAIEKGALNNCPVLENIHFYIPELDNITTEEIRIDKNFIEDGSPFVKAIEFDKGTIKIIPTDNGNEVNNIEDSFISHIAIAKDISGEVILEDNIFRFEQFLGKQELEEGEKFPATKDIMVHKIDDDGSDIIEKITVNLNWFENLEDARTENSQIELPLVNRKKVYYCKFER